MKINFILPFFITGPGGGIKVMYEYASRLAERGHSVYVYHSSETSYTSREGKRKNKLIRSYIRKTLRLRYLDEYPDWFNLHPSVVCKTIPYIDNLFIRNADAYVTTWWATAIDAYGLRKAKGTKVNLIQGYEADMTTHSDLVFESYKLPIHHIAISPYLLRVVSAYAPTTVAYIPNAIDLGVYRKIASIEERKIDSLIMRYSEQTIKGCEYAIKALIELKKKYSTLSVIFFSSEKKNDTIPDWITYVYNESNITPYYNESAILVLPSLNEGWSLPPMEAMACGCACVVSNIAGHSGTYLHNNENCILVEPKSVDDIINKISHLIDKPSERISLAKRGNEYIQKYDWSVAVDQMEEYLRSNS